MRAVAAQELTPARWIVVDDRSDDGTLEILRRLEPEVPFLTVMEAPAARGGTGPRPARPRRRAAHVQRRPRAAVDWREYTHVMKLDGDIELRAGLLPRADGALRRRPGARARRRRARRAGRRRRDAPHPDRRAATCTARSSSTRARASRRSAGSSGAARLGHDRRDLRADARLHGRGASPTSSRSTTARSAAPTARCAATRATASAPTSRTSRRPGCALRAVKVGTPAPVRALRRSPSSTATSARRSAASSGSPTRNTAGSPGRSCAAAWSARSLPRHEGAR